MAMAEDDGVGGGEAAAEAGEAPFGRSGVVDERHALTTDPDLQLLGQSPSQPRLVDVAVDRPDRRAERPQLPQHRGGDEVADVDRRLRRADQLEAALGQATLPLRHMGVSQNSDQQSSVREPSFYTPRVFRGDGGG